MEQRNPKRFWTALFAFLLAGTALLLWMSVQENHPERPPSPENSVTGPASAGSERGSAEIPEGATVAPSGDLAGAASEARRVGELRSAGWFKGTVSTGDGKPIGGARLSLWELIRNPPQPLATADSDREGNFEIQAPRPGRHRLTVERKGFAALEGYPELPAAGVLHWDLTMEPATASIRGRVTDENDQPLKDVRVGAFFQEIYSSARTSRFRPKEVRSDLRGEFAIDGLPAAEIALSFLAKGFLIDGTTVPLTDGGQANVRFRLKRGLLRELRVTDPQGAPIDQTLLNCGGPTLSSSDPEGLVQIVLRPEESGIVHCSLSAPGYLARDIQLDPKEKQELVVLRPGPEFRGIVLTPEGRPVPEAEISVSGASHHYEGTVSSDVSGRFSMRLSRPPVSALSVASPGFVETRLRFEEISEPNDVEIRLRRPNAGLFGRVTDSEGRPVRLFSVQLRGGNQVLRRSFNDPKGRFEIRDITSGSYEILISSQQPELSQVAVRKEAVEIRPGQILGELAFRFPAPPEQ